MSYSDHWLNCLQSFLTASLETYNSNHRKSLSLKAVSITSRLATHLEDSGSFALCSGKLSGYIFKLTPGPLYEIEIKIKYYIYTRF